MVNDGEIISFFRQKDYKVINNNLGSGSFGKTVLLQDPYIDELFVAKKYEPDSIELQKEFYQSFLQEIKILYKLNHRNIVRIYNYYPYEKSFTGFIIMEYVEGKTIDDFFNNYDPLVDRVGPDEVFVQLISAFQYLERHTILHRDIREGNILVDKNGIVKIIDFGLGKIIRPIATNEDSLVAIINRSGLDRLPREYFEGMYDSKTDMFYLAELLNRLMNHSGNKAFFTHQHILEKMMAIDPSDRYESFDEIIDSIGKKDFSSMQITREDKSFYQMFSNLILDGIVTFTSAKHFIDDVGLFEKALEATIKRNCFEDYIPINEVINTVVWCNYRYLDERVPIDAVNSFYDWFRSLSGESKQLVFNNLISKISTIKEESAEDIPF